MTGCPVNIADFRCRVMKARATQFTLRDTSRSSRLHMVEPLVLRDVSEECPAVCDIGIAREAQGLRRHSFRPVLNPRPAKVIRFAETRARAAVARASEPWTVSSGGPFDLPPAA